MLLVKLGAQVLSFVPGDTMMFSAIFIKDKTYHEYYEEPRAA